MIKRDGRGHSFCAARGEILGPAQYGRKQKHSPRMFSFIKNKVRGSKTIRYRRIIPTVNDADPRSGSVITMTTSLWVPGGVFFAKLKLKGIDGRAPPGVEPAA